MKGHNDLLQQVRAGKIAPAYFLCGETLPREEVVAALRQAIVGPEATAPMNLDTWVGKEATASRLLEALRTMPMFAQRRLVQVRDAHLIPSAELNKLIAYLDAPSPQSCLLLIGDKVDMRLKFVAAMRKKGGVVQRYDALRERELPAWIIARARQRGLGLEPGAAQRMAELVPCEMAQVDNAVEQLSLYVDDENSASVEDVDRLFSQTRQCSVFELTDAIGRGDLRRAMFSLKQMLDAKEPPLRILAMVARHLRQLWVLRELKAQRVSKAECAKRVGAHPYFVGDLLEQAGRIGAQRLEAMHEAVSRADCELKSSPVADRALMDQLVLSLCT